MDEPKALLYGGTEENDALPKVKYEDIPEDRRKKWASHLATFDGVVKSDEEFEEWLAVYMHRFYSDGNYEQHYKNVPKKYRDSKEDFEHMLHFDLGYHRAEYRHITQFKKWRVEHLDPKIEDLVDLAAHSPQYSWESLYYLERQKILCMRTYFSHSRMADKDGHFEGEMWMDICLDLLKYIQDDGMGIAYDKIQKMNIRNVKGLVEEDAIEDYLDAPEPGLDQETGLDKDKVDWECISMNSSIHWTVAMLQKFQGRIDWKALSRTGQKSLLCPEVVGKFENRWDWSELSGNSDLPEDTIEKFADRIVWRELLNSYRGRDEKLFSMAFLHKFEKYISASILKESNLWDALVDEKRDDLLKSICLG